MKKLGIILIIFALILSLIIIGVFAYLSNYYHADESVQEFLKPTDAVNVTEFNEYYFFDGIGDDKVFIFYPGAKVEEIAYARLMNGIAKNGIDCYLVKLPFRLALFNANGADYIIDNNNYKNVFVGGHSLGGVVACNYAYENMTKVQGLILIESRADVKLSNPLKVLSIRATNDGILNEKLYEEAKKYLPSEYKEVIIEGGNHANVANYGEQNGDKIATISREEQQEQTINAIIDFINGWDYESK